MGIIQSILSQYHPGDKVMISLRCSVANHRCEYKTVPAEVVKVSAKTVLAKIDGGTQYRVDHVHICKAAS